jgi:pimeloyl-ACP methyl ester carboxylesterase
VDLEQAVRQVAELISTAVPAKKAFIVGVHLGGYVAMLLAGRFPELCAGVVVVSACTNSPRSPYSGATRQRISVLQKALLNPGLNDTILPDVYAAIKLQWYTDWLPKYNGPVLFVNGENDSRDAEKSFTAACKGSKLRVVLGGDHLIWIDDKTYKKVNQYILQFIEASGWKGVGLTLPDNPFLEEDKNTIYNVKPTTDS